MIEVHAVAMHLMNISAKFEINSHQLKKQFFEKNAFKVFANKK